MDMEEIWDHAAQLKTFKLEDEFENSRDVRLLEFMKDRLESKSRIQTVCHMTGGAIKRALFNMRTLNEHIRSEFRLGKKDVTDSVDAGRVSEDDVFSIQELADGNTYVFFEEPCGNISTAISGYGSQDMGLCSLSFLASGRDYDAKDTAVKFAKSAYTASTGIEL